MPCGGRGKTGWLWDFYKFLGVQTCKECLSCIYEIDHKQKNISYFFEVKRMIQ